MTKQDFIYCEKGALSKDSCKNLITFFDNNKSKASPGSYTGDVGYINNLELSLDIRDNGKLHESITKAIYNYKTRYPLVDKFIGPWQVEHICQLMRYDPNKYYDKIHCENDCYLRPSVERVFGWMIYLNDIRRGGGTEFIHQRVTAKPRAGDFYIWPAGWTHMHRGVNAPKEVKYIITGWCSFRPHSQVYERPLYLRDKI